MTDVGAEQVWPGSAKAAFCMGTVRGTVLVFADNWWDPEGIFYILVKYWPSVFHSVFSKNNKKNFLACVSMHHLRRKNGSIMVLNWHI